MSVPSEIRRIEAEIDKAVQKLAVWKQQREFLLQELLAYYRDAIEVYFLHAAWGQLFDKAHALEVSFAAERDLHAGMLQALKWAMEFSSSTSKKKNVKPKMLKKVTELGARYESFVDALKMAKHGNAQLLLDEAKNTIKVFEGGDRTGFDSQLVSFQHRTLPVRHQFPFVEDGDQLTAKWSAGDFRSAMKALANAASKSETETLMFKMPGDPEPTPLFGRPVVFKIPQYLIDEYGHVFADILLDTTSVAPDKKWNLTSWLDVPLTGIGKDLVVVSNVPKALASAGGEDYMLRTAARTDPVQYSKVSELRHKRMIEVCKGILKEFEPQGPFFLSDPQMELDVWGKRGSTQIVLEIKSTLRPESPWEVHKRNEDVVLGVEHAFESAQRLGGATKAFLITDGYRGDYQTWEVSNRLGVPIGTIEDVPDLAKDLDSAAQVLKARAGFATGQSGGPLPNRVFQLIDWTIELIDARFPNDT